MGTIADKLTYLNGTKTALKDTINMSNAGITNETTFRDYAKKLRNGYVDIINNGTDDLYNNMPHLTGKSKELSLSPSYEAPMKITCYGDTTQYTTTGKNLWENRNATTNIPSGEITITETGFSYTRATTGGKYYYKKINVVNGTKYTFSLTSNPNNTAEVYVYSDIIYGTIVGHAYNSFTFTANETKEYVFAVIISSDKNSVDVSNIQLEIGNSATSYEPYTGGIPAPNPDFPQDIEVVKGHRNLFDTPETSSSNGVDLTRYSNGSIKLYGTSTAQVNFYKWFDYDELNLKDGGTYTFYANQALPPYCYILIEKYNNNTWLSNLISPLSSSTSNRTATIDLSGGNKIRFGVRTDTGHSYDISNLEIQLVEGKVSKPYVPYGNDYAYTKITGKNLFDKDNPNILNAKYSNGIITADNNERMCYIPCEPNTTYTLLKLSYNSMRNSIGTTQTLPSIGTTIEDAVYISTSPKTITTNANAKYIVWQFYAMNDTVHTYQEVLNSMQIEKSNTATTYEAYNGTEYVIKLGTTELCKIGNYEDKIFKSGGKNLFDKDNPNIYYGYVNSSNVITNDSGTISVYISCKPSTTYTIQKSGGSVFSLAYCNEIPANNGTAYERILNNSAPSLTITTGANAKYLISAVSGTSGYQDVLDTIMIEENSRATEYEPYGTEWHTKKATGKIVLDGTNNAIVSKSGTTSNNLFFTSEISNIKYPTSNDGIIPTYATHFRSTYINNLFANNVIGIGVHATLKGLGLGVSLSNTNNTVELINQWLASNNVIVYYPLATPTYTKITDSETISQLEALKSKNGTTNITSDMVLDVIVLKNE